MTADSGGCSKIVKPKTLHKLTRSRGFEPVEAVDVEIPAFVDKKGIKVKIKEWKPKQQLQYLYKSSSDISFDKSGYTSSPNINFDSNRYQITSNIDFDSKQSQLSSNIDSDKGSSLYQSSSAVNLDTNWYQSSTSINLGSSTLSRNSTPTTLSVKTFSQKILPVNDLYPKTGKNPPFALSPTSQAIDIDSLAHKASNYLGPKTYAGSCQSELQLLKIHANGRPSLDSGNSLSTANSANPRQSISSPINSIKVKSQVSPAYLSKSNPKLFSGSSSRPQTLSGLSSKNQLQQPKQTPPLQLSIFRPNCASSPSTEQRKQSDKLDRRPSQFTMSPVGQPNSYSAQPGSQPRPPSSNTSRDQDNVFCNSTSPIASNSSRTSNFDKWKRSNSSSGTESYHPNSEFPNMGRSTTPSYAWYQPAEIFREHFSPVDPFYNRFHSSPMSHNREASSFIDDSHDQSTWLEETSSTRSETYTMPPYRTSAIGIPSPRSVRKSMNTMPVSSYMNSFAFTKPKQTFPLNSWYIPSFDDVDRASTPVSLKKRAEVQKPTFPTDETFRGFYSRNADLGQTKQPPVCTRSTNPRVESSATIYLSTNNSRVKPTSSSYQVNMEANAASTPEPKQQQQNIVVAPKNPPLEQHVEQMFQTVAQGTVTAPAQNPPMPPCNANNANQSTVSNCSTPGVQNSFGATNSIDGGVDTSSIDESFHKAVFELEQKRMEQMKVKPPSETPLPKDFQSALKNFGEAVKTTQKVANCTVKSPSHESLNFQAIKLSEEKLKLLESRSCEKLDNVGTSEQDFYPSNYDEARQKYGPVVTQKKKSIDIDKDVKPEGKTDPAQDPPTPVDYQDARTRFGDPIKFKPVASSADPKKSSDTSQIVMPTLKATPKLADPKVSGQPSQIEMPALKATPKPTEPKVPDEPQIEIPVLKATPKPTEPKVSDQPCQIEMPALKATPKPMEPKVPDESQIEMPVLKATPKPMEAKMPDELQIEMPVLKATPKPTEPKVTNEPQIEIPALKATPKPTEPKLPDQPQIEMPVLKATPKHIESKVPDQPLLIEIPPLRSAPKPNDLREMENPVSTENPEPPTVKTPVDFEDAAKRFGQSLKRVPPGNPTAPLNGNNQTQEAPKFGQELLKSTGAYITEVGITSDKESVETPGEPVLPKNYNEARNIFETQNDGNKDKNTGANQAGAALNDSTGNNLQKQNYSLYTPSYVAKLTSANLSLESGSEESAFDYPSNSTFASALVPEGDQSGPNGSAMAPTNPPTDFDELSSGKLTEQQKAEVLNTFVEKEQDLKCMQQYPHISRNGSAYSSLRNLLGVTPGHQVDMIQQHQHYQQHIQQQTTMGASQRNPPLLVGVPTGYCSPRSENEATTPRKTGDTPKSARKAFRMFYSLDHSDGEGD